LSATDVVRYTPAMACAACERIERGRAGRDADFVTTLPESVVFLADEQTYRGYCLVLLNHHVEHLGDLSLERQLRLWEDVAQVAAALRAHVAPVRINYACLGNFLTHVHWHVIPRHADDPEPQHPIWVRPLDERHVTLPDAERRALITTLRRALA
jgi:diadenosine tetraphosphate (Ap4A) HIT family hydrolase